MTSVKIRHSTALYEEKLIYFLFFFIFQPAAAQWDSQLPSLLTLTFHVCSVSQNHQFHQYVISVNTQHCVQATPTLTCSCSSAPVQCPGGDPAPVLDLNWHYWFSLACHWSSVCAGDSLACCQIVSILLPCLRRVVGVSLCRRHVIAMLLPCRWRVAAVLNCTFVPDEMRSCDRQLWCGCCSRESLSAIFIKCVNKGAEWDVVSASNL